MNSAKNFLFTVLVILPFFANAQYPAASGTNATYEYIKNVSFSDINLTSGGLPYSDHTTEAVGGLVQNSTYTLNVTAHVTSGVWPEYVVVWIDWNHNYSFNDPGEQVLSGGAWFTNDKVFSANVTVPASAVSGETRMRVAQEYNTSPGNTGTFYWGEVEDYKLAIGVPAVMTNTVTSISIPNAIGGGNVINQDAGAITERGICWGTTINPTKADNFLINATASTGSWSDLMSGLISGQTYYVRAYAINAQGTGYGQNETFTGAINHYVSKTGSDATGTGSISAPWATVTHALSLANSGDKIIVLDDIIDNSITINKNITIEGLGAQTSKIMAASTPGSATQRVMSISSGVTATLNYLTISNGNFNGKGGGIYLNGTLTINECSVDNNNATGGNNGGGIYVITGSSLTINRSALISNSSNFGGAIYAEDNTNISLTNCTLGANSASRGGGIYNGTGQLNITNCTIANNSASSRGGGIFSNSNPSLIYLKNTIVALNTSPSGPDIRNTVNSDDYNLIQSTSKATINGTTTNNIYGTNPSLAAIALNGAQTQNYAPNTGSPVINAGTDVGATQTDQRGMYRLGTTDIGAYEYQGTATYIWDGAGSTGSWFTTSLWSGNFLPDNTTKATVRNGTCNVDNTSSAVLDLSIEATATLNVNTGFNLQIAGNVTNHSTSYTGLGFVELNGANSKIQNVKGKFGKIKLNNIYGASVIDTVITNNLLQLQLGNIAIGTGFLGINDVLTDNNGRLVTTTQSKLSFGDAGAAPIDTIPIGLSLSTLEINRAAGMLQKGTITIADSLKLTAGAYNIDTNYVYLNGVVSANTGTLTGSNKAVITVGGTGSALTLPSVTLKTLNINRTNGVKLSGNLTIADTINLAAGNLDFNAFNITLNGLIAGTKFLVGNGASDMIIQGTGGNFTLNFLTGFSTLNNLTLNRSGKVITLNSPLTLNGALNITAGDFNLSSSSNLTVNGNTSISGSLNLKSDATSTASFIDNGNITGGGTVERYIKGNDFHYISSPLTQVDTSIFTVVGSYQNRNFYSYDETKQSTWNGGNHDNITGWTSPAVVSTGGFLQATRGYALAYTGNIVYNLQGGNFQTGNYSSIPITYTDYADITTTYEGWNLVGNPYPSRLDANLFVTANSTLIESTLYFWDEPASNIYTSGDYATWNSLGTVAGGGGRTPNANIEVGQAFFVKAKVGASGNLSFTNAMRTHNASATFFKSAEIPFPKLKLAIISPNNNYNEILIGFKNDALKEKDNYDAYKNEGNAQLSFYSKIGNDNFAIQGLPFPIDSSSVQLGYHAGVQGSYSIKVAQITNFQTNTDIYLYDSLLDKYILLEDSTEYNFTTEVGRFDNRFQIIFNKFNIDKTSWTGQLSSAWNNAQNWDNGLPDKTKKAILNKGTVELTDDTAKAYSLVLGKDAQLKIDKNSQLTIRDSLIAQSSIVQSPEIYSFGELNYKHLLWKKEVTNSGYIALPFNTKNLIINGITNLEYFERGNWKNDYAFYADSLNQHFYRYSTNLGQDTVYLQSKINKGNFSYFVNDTGLYLLGNPFVHKINLNDKNTINWNQTTNSIYKTSNSKIQVFNIHYQVGINDISTDLNPFETFWINAQAQDTLIFNDIESDSTQEKTKFALVKLSIADDNLLSDELILVNDTINAKNTYNSIKINILTSNSISFYAISDQKNYAIYASNFVPDISHFNLGFYTAQKGNFSLKNTLNSSNYDITLIDNKLGDSILLSQSDVYKFSSDSGTFNDRFEVLVNSKHTSGIEKFSSEAKIYSNNNNEIRIILPYAINSEIRLFDLSGKQLLYTKRHRQNFTIHKSLPKGIYLVELNYKNKTLSQKVYIH